MNLQQSTHLKNHNISQFSIAKTAITCPVCAKQRAENLAILGAKSVLELCVGNSLQILERYYRSAGIHKVFGNDIDPRYSLSYPKGNWIIGDATKINTTGFDAVVVAPPLSKGCSGTRKDSLSIEQVFPSFYEFIKLPNKIVAFVLPGRTLSLKNDREQLHKFVSSLAGKVEIVPLINKVTKYVDVYRILK